MAKKKGRWACSCAVSFKEILTQVNMFRVHMGKRPMSSATLYRIRSDAAEAFLDAYPDGNYGLERNPYIATRVVGSAYVFAANRAAKLVRLGVKYEPPSSRGRKIGTRFKRGKMVLVGR
jgi:hypothetical protein